MYRRALLVRPALCVSHSQPQAAEAWLCCLATLLLTRVISKGMRALHNVVAYLSLVGGSAFLAAVGMSAGSVALTSSDRAAQVAEAQQAGGGH